MAEDVGGPEDRFPPFLGLLDSDRKKAWDEFYVFFKKAMSARLPKEIHLFPRHEHKDRLHDLLVAFWENDFHRLRQYQDQGKPFVGWLFFVSNRLLIEWRRKIDKIDEREVPIEPNSLGAIDLDSGPSLVPSVPDRLAAAVRAAFARLDTLCKALLVAAVLDELKPREIALLLRLPLDDNKAISDKVRSCRGSLRRRLRDEGYDADAFRRCMDA